MKSARSSKGMKRGGGTAASPDSKVLHRIANAVLDIQSKVSDIQAKVDAHDRRFDAIDKKLEGHDRRFEQVDRRFGRMDIRFDRIEEGLGFVDKTLEIIRLELGEGKAAQKDLAARVVVLEGR